MAKAKVVKWILVLVLAAVAMAIALLLMGCTMTRVSLDPATKAWKLERISWLQQVQVLRVNISTNGTASMEGYRNDGGAAVAKAAAEGAAEGAVRGLKP